HRFGLELGERDDEDIPLAQWLDRVRAGDISPAFAELYMNYTRYMLISASRAKGLPSNLQGLWNVWKEQTWESDYHTNINMQMNYWPAQAWGLSDCEEPLADWLELLAKTGARSARRNYQAGGWTVHHCSNPFGYAQPNFDVVGLWPMGGPWMSRHLYEMWAYGRDYEQMRNRLYPIIRGSAEFILDFLVEAPEGTACPGCLVTNPSVSPENEYYLADGSRGMLTYGCTMDIQIIRDLFDNILELIEEIQMREPGFDAALAQRIREASARLPEIKISSKGNIQEWIEDYEEVDPGHRHMSHLYGVYPGRTISPESSPELAAAARRTIERKYEAGYDGQGWSMGWQACIRARLGDGEPAYQVLCENFRRHILPNLMINSHGVAQVGDAFGIPAAMLEMLVQSHEGRIVLLPAIPKAWHTGRVTGLRVRQNHSVDMEWKDGQVVHALICHGKDAKDMPVVLKNPENYEIVHTGEATEITLKK
ncbi:MAG: glycosyl hydrolase family 95 catalytic domain-containing protein, partial [Butyricicoccus sp.]